jgi:hypothetical protein
MTASVETVELWCSDCRGKAIFEVVPVDSDAHPHEWACTTCGAGYVEAYDVVIEIEAAVRGVA